MESRTERGAGDRRGGKVGMDAETKAGPWLGDTPGFNNHFIPCTRDSRRSWAGGREGTILDAKVGEGQGKGTGTREIYIYIDTLI